MKKTIVSIACCALITPLAFAKESKQKKLATTYEEGVTVAGTTITTIEGGTAASHQPANTLLVNQNDRKDPNRYVLYGRGHIVNRKGEAIRTAIHPGTRVHVYFASTGGVKTIDRVVVD
jgi:hypothetical protein